MQKRRIAVLAVILLLAVAGTALGNHYAYERYYYTDSTYTVECGFEANYCNRFVKNGCTTAYYNEDFFTWC